MFQRFRSLVEDVIEVTKGSADAVGTTIDEVRRALIRGTLLNDHDVDVIRREESKGGRAGPGAGGCWVNNGPSALPEEEDKKLLKDLLDPRNFGAASTVKTTPTPSTSVRVCQIYSSKYQDSDDDDESSSTGGVDSPQPSSGSGFGFKKNNDSFRCSSRTNDFGDGNFAYAVDDGNSMKGNGGRGLGQDAGRRLGRDGHGSGRVEDDGLTEDEPSAGWYKSRTSIESLKNDATLPVDTASSVDTVVLVGVGESFAASNTFSGLKNDNMEENNNYSATRQLSSPNEIRFSIAPIEEDHCDGDKRSTASLNSAVHSSMPSIAPMAVRANNEKNTTNGVLSDEENEDIGEMFAMYGAQKANSQSNLNKISPFSGSKESINSCYSNAGEGNYGKFPVTGEILLGLSYNFTLNILEVAVKRCKDLAPVDQKRMRSDPYVKTFLLPDRTKTGKRKTRIKKHTLNPVFDEILKYQISKSELETRTLSAMVWNSDRFGRNDFLGEVNIALDYYMFDDPTPVWHKLQDRVLSSLSMLTYKGDLNLCLKFVSAEHISGKRRSISQKGELQVIIKEARNLTAVRSNGHSDPFCKGYLLPDKSHQTKQKTTVVKKNCNPKWNRTFLFENVSWEELQERSLELTIWDHDRLTSNDFLGGVRLNLGTGKSNGKEVAWMDARGEELFLWQAVLDRPDCWIEGTLLLRINMNQLK